MTATLERREAMIGHISVLAAAALFGAVFTIAKVPLLSIDPLTLSAITYVVSGVALVPFARASFRMPSRRQYVYILVISLIGAAAAPALLLYGLQQTAASDASILANGEVLFTIILAAAFFGERPKGRIGIFAVTLVIIGLFMATTNLRLSDTVLQFNSGNFMILGAMGLWAVDNNLSRRLTASVDPSKIAMVKSLIGGGVLFAVAAMIGKAGIVFSISPELWAIIVGMAVSGFGGALLLFLQGIKRIGTVKTMSIFSLTPVFGIVVAAIFLSESISIVQGVATAVIIVGILILTRH